MEWWNGKTGTGNWLLGCHERVHQPSSPSKCNRPHHQHIVIRYEGDWVGGLREGKGKYLSKSTGLTINATPAILIKDLKDGADNYTFEILQIHFCNCAQGANTKESMWPTWRRAPANTLFPTGIRTRACGREDSDMDKGLTLGRRRMKSRKHTNDLLLLSIFSIVVFLITFKLLGADQPQKIALHHIFSLYPSHSSNFYPFHRCLPLAMSPNSHSLSLSMKQKLWFWIKRWLISFD